MNGRPEMQESFMETLIHYLPLIIAVIALAFCYLLYRNIHSDDTQETLHKFMLKTTAWKVNKTSDKFDFLRKQNDENIEQSHEAVTRNNQRKNQMNLLSQN